MACYPGTAEKKKSHVFSAPSGDPLATRTTFSALKVARPFGSQNKLCLGSPPWRLRGGVPAYLPRERWGEQCLAQVCPFDDTKRGRKNVLPETFWSEEFWVLWNRRTAFPRSLHLNCAWDRPAIPQKAMVACRKPALRTQAWFRALVRRGRRCFLVGSGHLLTRALGGPHLKSRRHLWNVNMHLNRTL